VWTVVSKLRVRGDFGRTIREIARLSRCSVGAVAKTKIWKEYLRKRKAVGSRQRIGRSAEPRRRHQAESVEGRVYQIVREAGKDYSLTVRKIAEIIGCSGAAVAKTQGWKGYVQAREADKEEGATRIRRRRQRKRIR